MKPVKPSFPWPQKQKTGGSHTQVIYAFMLVEHGSKQVKPKWD
jgi:hypothetical protein